MNQSIQDRDRIIVALDFPVDSEAFRLVDRLGDSIRFYKIGLQLFTRYGPDIIQKIQATGARVFLDLKFNDIPNTVQHSVSSACELGVDLTTIHLSGGRKMIEAAIAGRKESSSTCILGVTVLTSSNDATLREVAVSGSVEEQVLRLAQLGMMAGLRGYVASPLEIAPLRKLFGPEPVLVTPGVRPTWAAANDQQRIMTPGEAIRAGATYLVIGRPITADLNPQEAATRILEEISGQ